MLQLTPVPTSPSFSYIIENNLTSIGKIASDFLKCFQYARFFYLKLSIQCCVVIVLNDVMMLSDNISAKLVPSMVTMNCYICFKNQTNIVKNATSSKRIDIGPIANI